MSEVRLAKFEILIEDINKIIKKQTSSSWVGSIVGSAFGFNRNNIKNVELSLIFDYDSCNEYAKIIIDKSELLIDSIDGRGIDKWKERYPDMASLSDVKTKIDAAKQFVQYCRESQNTSERYKFIFWSLMILTVDKNNAEEYLALICDFAKMLRISCEEFEDIIYAIKCVYNEVDKEYIFKSESIPAVLGGIFNLYDGLANAEFVEV